MYTSSVDSVLYPSFRLSLNIVNCYLFSCYDTYLSMDQYLPFETKTTCWKAINSICLVWSLLLFLGEISSVTYLDLLKETREYLVYNFFTTIIWITEVGGPLLNSINRRRDVSISGDDDVEERSVLSEVRFLSSLPETFELAVALYFLIDSIHLLFKWINPELDINGNIVDIIVNIVGYSYQILKSHQEYISDLEGYTEV